MVIEDEDPTIISYILNEFRANANNYYRSSMLSTNITHDKTSSTLSRARRLKFEDSTNSTSDVPDVPNKKLKLTTPQIREAGKGSNVMSPWEIRLLKSDRIKFKSHVIEAEERIQKLEGLKLETELRYAREKKIIEDALSQERNRVTELENRIAFIRKREAEAIEKYTQLKLCENNLERNLRQVIIDLQKENQNLKEQVYELNEDIENHKKQEKDEINSLRI